MSLLIELKNIANPIPVKRWLQEFFNDGLTIADFQKLLAKNYKLHYSYKTVYKTVRPFVKLKKKKPVLKPKKRRVGKMESSIKYWNDKANELGYDTVNKAITDLKKQGHTYKSISEKFGVTYIAL